ncbi:MAG: VWA domain-containing protein, partial [Acidiferrobacterales bacterium]|nr:VWA domain-containing protein [Acidiferrobacterales bacterium]
MTVGFLTPLFLAAAAALAVPILVHLVRRQDRASAPFPSLMFIQRLPRRERRRRTLHHRPLLLLRCLALGLLCLAFAQPFFELSPTSVSGPEASRDRVVVLDRSYSMGYGDRWEQAVRTARQTIEELRGGDRGALVLFDHETEIAEALTADHRSLVPILAAARPGAGHTRLLGAIESAGRLLADSTATHREIVLISDFQRTGFEAGKHVPVPVGTRVMPHPISGGSAANAALVAVNVVRRSHDAGDALQLVARVLNTGTVTMEKIDVVLEVNDRERARDTLALKTGEAGEATFDLVIDATAPSRVRIRIGSDALAADNAYHLVLTSGQTISVQLLQDPGARPGQALYLQQALDQGTEPAFQVDIRTAAEIGEDALDNVDVVVINDAPIPGGRVGQALQRYLHAGGGLLIVAADQLQGAWPNDKTGFVPGVLGPAAHRDDDNPARIMGANLTHPVWAAFADPDGGDLAGAQVYHYRIL